jgi:hypothetical protein
MTGTLSAKALTAISLLETDSTFPRLAGANLLKARLYRDINARLASPVTATEDETISMSMALLFHEVSDFRCLLAIVSSKPLRCRYQADPCTYCRFAEVMKKQ